MVDRIKSIMDYYHMTPAQFADKIGFQRSALSHVLSGRNNPSLDFVLKVKSSFPDISLDWLTLGEGNQFEDATMASHEKVVGAEDHGISDPTVQGVASGLEEKKLAELPSAVEEKEDSTQSMDVKSEEYQPVKGGKSIKKIILLYADGSFSEHVPEK